MIFSRYWLHVTDLLYVNWNTLSIKKSNHYTQTYLYNVIIKQKPEAMTLHYSDIMTSIWTTTKKKT